MGRHREGEGQGCKKKVEPIDYGPIEDFLVGRCGMSQVQAASVGMTEYLQRLKGWEAGQHEEWERVRWLAFHQYNLSPFLKAGQRPKTPRDLAPFPWEDAPKRKKITRKMARITQAEQDALNAIMKDFFQNKYSC